MYLPEPFKEIRETEIASVMRGAPLACIVTQTEAGLIANHLPSLTISDGTIVGHMGRLRLSGTSASARRRLKISAGAQALSNISKLLLETCPPKSIR